MRPLFVCLAVLPCLGLSQAFSENWSPEEGNSTFEPSATVLEQWSGLGERTDKVMKKPDRHIMNRPPGQEHVKPDGKVSETDLFLLGAIEKLAYRMEYLEKRLSRAEEMIYQLLSGNQFNEKQDPCPERFWRIGEICYHVSEKQVNWKSASSMCRGLNSALLEFESSHEKKALFNALKDSAYQGKDFWTGGLNPGLLWIWSNSAKPVIGNSTGSEEGPSIDGNGRCLVLKYRATTQSYIYKGIDCSSRNYYICRYLENSVARRLDRLQRELQIRNGTGLTT